MGRLGLHAGALPVILPVAYALDGDNIIVRTHEAAQVYGAARESVVAFEIDRQPGAPQEAGASSSPAWRRR